MPKQNVSFNFSQGINSKTDPWQLQLGQFEDLQNSVFQKGGLFQKRDGYGILSTSSPPTTYLTTLSDNLISIGNTVSAFSPSLSTWVTKGTLQPCGLSVLPLIRNNLNQTQSDSVVSSGMVLTFYTQTNQTTSTVVTQYLYTIADVETGQNIVQPSSIPVLSGGTINGSSRAYVVGNRFVIVSPVLVSATTFLQYFSIPISNPVDTTTNLPNASVAQNTFPEAYVSTTSNPGWDAVSVSTSTEGVLVIAYNTNAGGQGVHVTVLTSSQITNNLASSSVKTFTDASYIASILSICVDLTANPNIYYVSFVDSGSGDGYTCSVYIGFGTITTNFAPTKVISGTGAENIASVAINGSCLVMSEILNNYAYDSSVPDNFINAVTISSSGSVGSPYVLIRSLGISSKGFIVNGSYYFIGAYQSTFQPTYFLINASTSVQAKPIIVAKLAYQNGGGYVSLGLPGVTVSGNIAQITYRFKDDVEALNTLNNTQQLAVGGIYSQTGINLVSFDLGTDTIDTSEIAGNLHISGGYLSQFDGYLPNEHNFFLFPEPVEVTYNASSTVTPTATTTTGSKVLTAVSSVSGVAPGMTVTGIAIPANAVIVLVGTNTITMNVAATGNHAAETVTIQGNIEAVPSGGTAGAGAYYYQATYEWTDNQGLAYRSSPSIPVAVTTSGSGTAGTVTVNVPTLRLTSKISNPVKIVIYRWSEFTQVYNQVTSITAPILNDTTTDSISFVDPYPDSLVIGNNILYTTGGVVPDANAPACNGIMTLFDTRLWLVDAEDPNTLRISKQVIAGTPVEMSSLFTIYVAPNIGTTASTGPMRAIAPMDDKIILFKKDSAFYINGAGPDNLGTTSPGCSLGNYSQPIFITSVVGCTNQKSIVLTQDGLMFQSDKGIWILNRSLQTSYIGAPVEKFNSSIVTSANVIPGTNHVLFTLNTGEMLMYDYFYGQWGTFTGAAATSSCIQNGLHTLINKFGQILQSTPGKYLDATNPVLMSFKTPWLNVASLQGYERFYGFYLLARYLSPHSLNLEVAYDYNSSVVHRTIVTPKNFSPSDPGSFGIPTPFGSPGDKEQWKIDAKRQLCESFQLTVSEVFDREFGTNPGAGFTMSGITCELGIKKGTRPIRGANSSGLGN